MSFGGGFGSAYQSSQSVSQKQSSFDDIVMRGLGRIRYIRMLTNNCSSPFRFPPSRASISALKVCPSCGPAVKEHVLPNALVLSVSPLLQDLALDSLLALLEQIVVCNAVDFHDLLSMLRGKLEQASSSKHAIYNLGKCIAVITSVASPENCLGVINETLASLEGSRVPEDTPALKQVQLALLVSGDLGRIIDLSTIPGVTDKLQTIYMGYFESSSEDLKYAAAYALGRAVPIMFL
jgi:hypothetical protein